MLNESTALFTIWVVQPQLQKVASDHLKVVGPPDAVATNQGKCVLAGEMHKMAWRLNLLKARGRESESSWVPIPIYFKN